MLHFELSNRKFKFNITIYGKLNFIIGESGSHKSYLAEVVNDYLDKIHGTKGDFWLDGMRVEKEHILVFDNKNNLNTYKFELENRKNCIIIIDEFSKLHKEKDIGKLIMSSENYFIFMTRKVYGFLPVNILSVYYLDRDVNTIVNRQAYRKFEESHFGVVNYILTEDSSSGRKFFIRNFQDIEVCSDYVIYNGKKHFRDNSQLHNYLLWDACCGKDFILVVYDSSAYAAFYPLLLETLEKCRKMGRKVKVLDWESFETYLLSLPMFDEHYTVDSTKCQFNSVEQLSEARLKEKINYSKNKLPVCFDRNFKCSSCKKLSICELKKKRKEIEIVYGVLSSISSCGTIL